jgi:hypothetical protein
LRPRNRLNGWPRKKSVRRPKKSLRKELNWREAKKCVWLEAKKEA